MIPTTLEFHERWSAFFEKYVEQLTTEQIVAYQHDWAEGLEPPSSISPTDLDV